MYTYRYTDDYIDLLVRCLHVDPDQRHSAEMLLTHPFLLRCLPSFTATTPTTPGPSPGPTPGFSTRVPESSSGGRSGDLQADEIAQPRETEEAERGAISGGRVGVQMGEPAVPVQEPAQPEPVPEPEVVEVEADISTIPRIRLMSYSNKFDQFLISKRDVYCDNIIQKITDW